MEWLPTIGIVAALLIAFLVFVFIVAISVFIAAAVLRKRTGIDITDGIDAKEWSMIKEIYVDQTRRETVAATKERMIVAASDEPVKKSK